MITWFALAVVLPLVAPLLILLITHRADVALRLLYWRYLVTCRLYGWRPRDYLRWRYYDAQR